MCCNVRTFRQGQFLESLTQSRVWGCQYLASREDVCSQEHCNSVGVLVYTHKGMVALSAGDDTIIKFPEMVCYIPPNLPYIVNHLDPGTSGIFLQIPDSRAEFLPNRICALSASDVLRVLFKRIASWGPVREKTLLQQRLVQVFLDELRLTPESDSLCIPLPDNPVLKDMAIQIINNPDDGRGLEDWADFTRMSRRTFTRSFYEDVGLSFGKWRQLIRLQHALFKLQEGKTVLETAYNLGYQSPSTLISHFQKTFGVPPRKYIEDQKNKKGGLSALVPYLTFSVVWLDNHLELSQGFGIL